MQWVKSFKDLAEYCESRPYVHVWETGYLLYTKREIVDLASKSPMSISQLMDIVRKLKSFYGSHSIEADFREKTSYKILTFGERKNIIHIISDYEYEWDREIFHEVEFKFL